MEISKKISSVLKGFAIIMVVLSHFRKLTDIPRGMELLMNPCGYLGVAVFLFLSGYGCALSKSKNNFHTLGYRVGRILIPLSICTFVSAAIISPPPTLYQDVMLQSIGLNSKFCPPMWYLTLQMFCYISMLIIGTTSSKKKIIIFCVLCSMMIMTMSVSVDIDGTGVYMWGLNAFSFQTGVIMAHLNLSDKICKKLLIIAGVSFVTMFIFTYKYLGNPDALIEKNPLKSVISLAFILIIYSAAMIYRDKIGRLSILKFLGKYSFYIYLVHAFYIFTFNKIAYNANVLNAVFLLLVVLIIICPMLKWADEKAKMEFGL